MLDSHAICITRIVNLPQGHSLSCLLLVQRSVLLVPLVMADIIQDTNINRVWCHPKKGIQSVSTRFTRPNYCTILIPRFVSTLSIVLAHTASIIIPADI